MNALMVFAIALGLAAVVGAMRHRRGASLRFRPMPPVGSQPGREVPRKAGRRLRRTATTDAEKAA